MSVGEITASVSASTGVSRAVSRVRWGWIVGPHVDLPWFLGGAFFAYVLFALHAFNQTQDDPADLGLVWVGWFALSNIPHFFGTYVRLYLDPEERRQRSKLAWGSLGVIATGPILVCVCWLLFHAGEGIQEYHHLPFDLLTVFAGLWAYWHMVRQHYGFLALYKRKNQDTARADRWLDSALLHVALLGPLLAFALGHPFTRYKLGLAEDIAEWGWEAMVVAAIQVVLISLLLCFVTRQLWLCRRGEAINGPKILLFVALVPLYSLIGYHPVTLTASMLAFSAFITIFHDVQYHAIVYSHQRNRCHSRGVDRGRFGLAALVTSSVWLYLGCAVGMGVVGWAISCRLDMYPGCTPIFASSELFMFGEVRWRDLLLGVGLGFAMHHYFVDQFIWRPSKSAELRRDLRLNAPV